jgi:hypothetical protein
VIAAVIADVMAEAKVSTSCAVERLLASDSGGRYSMSLALSVSQFVLSKLNDCWSWVRISGQSLRMVSTGRWSEPWSFGFEIRHLMTPCSMI